MLSTIGYEGAHLRDFLATLEVAGVDIIVDIRDRAQSRRPGYSKTSLQAALNSRGIAYVHFRELGDPKSGRDAARAGQMDRFRAIYRSVLESGPAKTALGQIRELVVNQSVCLLCFERDYRDCHRKLVADHIESASGLRARHLGVNPNVAITGCSGRMRHTGQSASA